MPIMLPPGGDWVDIWRAADWTAKREEVRFVVIVDVIRSGGMLF